jgi:hypothetical protein
MGVCITWRQVRRGIGRTMPGELRFPTSLKERANSETARCTQLMDSVALVLRQAGTAQSNLLSEPPGVAVRRMEKRGAGHGTIPTGPLPRTAPFQNALGKLRKGAAASSVAVPPSTLPTRRWRSGAPTRLNNGLGRRESRRKVGSGAATPAREIFAGLHRSPRPKRRKRAATLYARKRTPPCERTSAKRQQVTSACNAA